MTEQRVPPGEIGSAVSHSTSKSTMTSCPDVVVKLVKGYTSESALAAGMCTLPMSFDGINGQQKLSTEGVLASFTSIDAWCGRLRGVRVISMCMLIR